MAPTWSSHDCAKDCTCSARERVQSSSESGSDSGHDSGFLSNVEQSLHEAATRAVVADAHRAALAELAPGFTQAHFELNLALAAHNADQSTDRRVFMNSILNDRQPTNNTNQIAAVLHGLKSLLETFDMWRPLETLGGEVISQKSTDIIERARRRLDVPDDGDYLQYLLLGAARLEGELHVALAIHQME